ncbi:MAG: ATP-dependent DNA helicase, partial [Deltaproteobacteria bacterium]|nr:ATP-dependent DNA helicase [Deltaproteobacteria bacterium]
EQNPLPQRDIALALAQAKAAAEAADEPADATGADPRPVSLADYADEFIDQPDEERIDIFQRKLAEIVEVTSFLGDHSDETFVYQVSVKGSGPEKGGKKSKKEAGIKVTFAALPLEAGRILGHKLKGVKKTIVITSATLSTGGDFAYFKNRFDLEPETPSMTLDSPFDYAKNTVLYLPAHMPDVTKGDYPRAFMDETVKLLNLSKGRALVLFTSIARLKEVSRELQDKIPWPVMVQYEDTKANLLDRFKNNVNSVLLATSSFWQGIDVPGESLSVVIIDRLPFEPPSLPLFKGRERLLRERGLSPFYAYSLPQMLLTLRQGLGRLLRSSTDRGVLAIFDNRAASARYAKTIQKSLPPSHQAKKLSDLEGFLSSL